MFAVEPIFCDCAGEVVGEEDFEIVFRLDEPARGAISIFGAGGDLALGQFDIIAGRRGGRCC